MRTILIRQMYCQIISTVQCQWSPVTVNSHWSIWDYILCQELRRSSPVQCALLVCFLSLWWEFDYPGMWLLGLVITCVLGLWLVITWVCGSTKTSTQWRIKLQPDWAHAFPEQSSSLQSCGSSYLVNNKYIADHWVIGY